MTKWTIAIALACAALGTAGADEFDNKVAGATAVDGRFALAALLWSEVTACDGITNELEKRQCLGVRDARRAHNRAATFAVDGDAGAVELGKFDDKRKSMPFEIAPCLACAAPVDVDGDAYFVVGQGAVKVDGGKVVVAPLHKSTRTFASQAEADTWKAEVAPRLRTQFVARLGKAKAWKSGGAQGMQLEVVAFRVYDPCTGEVLAAEPAVANLPADTSACPESAKPVEPQKPVEEVKPVEPPKPKLPQKLSPFEINRAMAPVRPASQKCFQAYGVTGDASFAITINNEGAITDVKQTGDFVGTPTGDCIEQAVRAVTFPPMKNASMTFDYPVVLR